MAPERDARTYYRLGPHPDTILDHNRSYNEIESLFRVIVVTGAEIGPLGDTDIAADTDFVQRVEQDAFADPGVVADFEVPGIFDVDAGF